MNRQKLRAIALNQRYIMFCILAYVCLLACQFVVPDAIRVLLGIMALGVSIAAMVFVFRLATGIYSRRLGIILGVLTLIPLVGLAVLLIVNAKATRILKHHNITVGILGADVSNV